jgi:hypothetical protein
MSQAKRIEAASTNQAEPHGPPMPKFMFKLVNPLMKWMLNSPFHGRMSQRLMVLSFTGRKTGKHYSTPVGYVQQNNELFVFTHSPWRNNFKKPAPVSMRIQGKDVTGTAHLVSDPLRIKQMIQALAATNGEDLSRRMGFWVENLDTASPEAVLEATRGTYFIEIQVDNGK